MRLDLQLKKRFINNVYGKPEIIILDESIESMDISISHCKEYAIANVVILYK